ncbi:MAG: aldo/keto reductase [Acholeplasmatales bacterium]|nr:aldo/keto reductase [Acholeplasmatales bacterium]
MVKDEVFTLYNGVSIPKVGLGTWQSPVEDAYRATLYALKVGYRHIDTALVYQNEEGVGKAIKDSGLPREEIFVTTKCPADIKTYKGAMEAFETSLKNLDLDYVDLYLIHAPWPWSAVGSDCTEGNIEVWKAFIELYNAKKIRAIGVSNFHDTDIEPLIMATGVKPMVNQIRYFLGNTQPKITKYCQDNHILVQAYSPLATGKMLDNPDLLKVAEKYNTTPAKICLRYCIDKGTNPLPKSVHEERIKANLELDFKISDEDIKILDSIHDESLDRPLRS